MISALIAFLFSFLVRKKKQGSPKTKDWHSAYKWDKWLCIAAIYFLSFAAKAQDTIKVQCGYDYFNVNDTVQVQCGYDYIYTNDTFSVQCGYDYTHANDTFSVQCGYDYSTDTISTSIDSVCNSVTVHYKVPCYIGWGWWRRKSVCNRDSVQRSCTYDTSYTTQRDSTAKFCDSIVINLIDSTAKFCDSIVYRITDSTAKFCDSIITFQDSTIKYCDSIIAATAKPPLSGLALRQEAWFRTIPPGPDTAWLNAFGGNICLHIYLKNIWPSANTFDFSYIDGWVTFARNMEAIGVPIRYKLRVLPGLFVPQWMRDSVGAFPLDHTGFETTPGFDIADDSCIKFWLPKYFTYNNQLQTALAAHYDTVKYISEVTMSSTAVGTDEAMEWGMGNGQQSFINRRDQFIAAGATPTNTLAAIYAGIDAMSVWHQTNIGIVLTAFQHASMPMVGETITSKQIGTYMANLYGSRCVLGNNGLRTTAGQDGAKWAAPNGQLYDMQQYYIQTHNTYHSRIYNQTASEKQMNGYSNLLAVLNAGVGYKDILIELPDVENKIKANLTNAQLRFYRDACKNNLP